MVESQKKIKEIKFNEISHPLDPLTSEEINLVTSIVKNKSNLGKFLLFETITLIEPPKNQVLSFSLGDEIRRKAFVVALNYKEEKLYELDIDISNEKILRCDHKPGVQPAFIFGDLEMDFNEWESKMKHDPLVVDALKKRGIDDPD